MLKRTVTLPMVRSLFILVVIPYIFSLELSSGITTARGCGVGGDLVQYLQVFNPTIQQSQVFIILLFRCFFSLLEFPCVRALLMSSGKTLSAFQGLDSMTHRRLDIVFLLLIYLNQNHLSISQVCICTRDGCNKDYTSSRSTYAYYPRLGPNATSAAGQFILVLSHEQG